MSGLLPKAFLLALLVALPARVMPAQDRALAEADSLTRLGDALYDEGRFPAAEPLHRRALTLVTASTPSLQ